MLPSSLELPIVEKSWLTSQSELIWQDSNNLCSDAFPARETCFTSLPIPNNTYPLLQNEGCVSKVQRPVNDACKTAPTLLHSASSRSSPESLPARRPLEACLLHSCSLCSPCLAFSCSTPPNIRLRREGVPGPLLPPSLNAPSDRLGPIEDLRVSDTTSSLELRQKTHLPQGQ